MMGEIPLDTTNGIFRHDNSVAPEPSKLMSLFSLKGKTAIVSGAGAGIGLAVAQGLAEAGANVAIWYNSNKKAIDRAKEITTTYNVRCEAYQVNVVDPDNVKEVVDQIAKEFNGRLDIFVANSGIAWTKGAALDGPIEDYQKVVRTDLDGTYYCALAAGAHFRRQVQEQTDLNGNKVEFREGSFIATASMSAHIVNIPQFQASYNAAKAGVIHLCKSLAVEWVGFGRVNSISPGYIATEITGFVSQETKSGWKDRIPMGREGQTGELKGAYLYLASEAASYTTGIDLRVDGGYCRNSLNADSAKISHRKSKGFKAADHVGLSRLHLALRGLETPNAVVRIAVLYLGRREIALDLVKSLVSDIREADQGWTRINRELQDAVKGSLLLRFGESGQLTRSAAQLPAFTIDSNTLRTHNVEFLISPAPTGTATAGFLVPMLEIQAAGERRQSFITYPVHRSIVVGAGFGGALEYGRLFSTSSERLADDNVKLLLRGSKEGEDGAEWFSFGASDRHSDPQPLPVSNLPDIMDWATRGASPVLDSVKPVVIDLVRNLTKETAANVQREQKFESDRQSRMSHASQAQMAKAVSQWAESAHRDLRDGLDTAFAEKEWNRLAWWKLWWKVDDVDSTVAEVLQRQWLANAEKELIWTCGQLGNSWEIRYSTTLAQGGLDAREDFLPRQTWLHSIEQARNTLISVTAPSLQSHAQSLLLQSFSTISGSIALSALVFVSWQSGTGLEAGAIATLGLSIALKRLQKEWESARRTWEETIRRQAKQTLKQTEAALRNRIEQTSEPGVAGALALTHLEEASGALKLVGHAFQEIKDTAKTSPAIETTTLVDPRDKGS
ncbi:MAG: hypothetical protein M1814_005719 [Vezdaea aestivalis]|nr:MAG: hypothetical protein M1814_005719 [Vezdaea aestivalis]